MYLIDTNAGIHCDEVGMSERIVTSLQHSPVDCRVIFDESHGLCYRFMPDGDLWMYFVGTRPFLKVHLSLWDLHSYQDHGEIVTADFRILHHHEGTAACYMGDNMFYIPEELLFTW